MSPRSLFLLLGLFESSIFLLLILDAWSLPSVENRPKPMGGHEAVFFTESRAVLFGQRGWDSVEQHLHFES